MKTKTSGLWFVAALSMLSGIAMKCHDDNYDFTYGTIVTEVPVNLEGLNTEYDDYNSSLPYQALGQGIYFSTNRKSAGGNFDFIFRELDISYHSRDDIINISYVSSSNTYDPFDVALEEINTVYDELGPYYYWGMGDYEYLFYANDESGNFDMKYVSARKGTPGDFYLTDSLSYLNSEYDDLYPCLSDNVIYFCSNRENGTYSIFTSSFSENLIDSCHGEIRSDRIELNGTLSSERNDKCPYLHGGILVFTSDREGGYGGYDLYYSRRIDDVWSEPQNFGSKINTEFDEYRPVVVPFYDIDDTVLIFSSNRTGGKGGFDLYSVRTVL